MHVPSFAPLSTALLIAIGATGVLIAAPLPGVAAPAQKDARTDIPPGTQTAEPRAVEPAAQRVVVKGPRMSPAERRAFDAGVIEGRRLAQEEAAGDGGEQTSERFNPGPPLRSSRTPNARRRLAGRSPAEPGTMPQARRVGLGGDDAARRWRGSDRFGGV